MDFSTIDGINRFLIDIYTDHLDFTGRKCSSGGKAYIAQAYNRNGFK